MRRIAYLGPAGTFTHLALKKYASSYDDIEQIPLTSFFDLFVHLQEKKCDAIIVPIENSVGGPVTGSLALLTESEGVKISNEILLPIQHSLLGLKAHKGKDITDIVSHPQALLQCARYLQEHYPNVVHHQSASTALAVQMMKKNADEKVMGVIGHERLASEYDLDLLDKDINDFKSNTTRFLVLTNNGDTEPT